MANRSPSRPNPESFGICPWRRELLTDIHHAEQRSMLRLAGDLRRLHARIERTHALGQILQKALER